LIQDTEKRDYLIKSARADAERFISKYKTLEELSDVVSDMETALERLS